MKKPIVILGNGYIGRRLQAGLGGVIVSQRILSLKDVETVIKQYNPGIMINCIGFTGERNVDDCERDPEKTLTSNSFVPILLAEGALRNNVKLVHISSGCIYHYDYDHPQPVTEQQEPDYFNLFYSRSKIYSEQPLVNLSRQYDILVVRIRIPLDDHPYPRNILTKLITYKTIIDVPNSVTYIPDFVEALKFLIRKKARGLFNVVNKGSLRYPDLLKVYQKYDPDFRFEVIPYRRLNLDRTNLVLSTRKLETAGFRIRPIKDVLEEAVKGFVKRREKAS